MQEPRRIAAVTAHRHRIGDSHSTSQARTRRSVRHRRAQPGGDSHPTLQEPRRIAAVTAHRHRNGASHSTSQARTRRSVRHRRAQPGGDSHPTLQEPRRIAAVTAHRHRNGASHSTSQARTADPSVIAELNRAGIATLLWGGEHTSFRLSDSTSSAANLKRLAGQQPLPNSRSKANGKRGFGIGLQPTTGLTYGQALGLRELRSRQRERPLSFSGL
jgi:hypothetical protein